jgi:hypothetical protein
MCRQFTAKTDVTIRVLLTVTPVVPKEKHLEDVAKKRVPYTLIRSSSIVEILKEMLNYKNSLGFI